MSRGSALVREDLAAVDVDAMWGGGEALAHARGRAGVSVLEIGGLRVAARDYKRGGALRGVLGDRYMDPRRAERELEALHAMQRAGVPVVPPLAALSRRVGVGHRLRLLTELVEGALPLPAFVARHPEHRRAAVREAGRVVAMAFDRGLVHLDLHADNLLAREAGAGVEVLLIDLDRARLRERLAERDRDAMLLRMARYQFRHSDRVTTQRVDWPRFLAGMGSGREARRRTIERLRPPLVRMLRRHGIST